MCPQPSHRKEREKQIRQQEILKAARELFLLKGYHETTLEEIARHAEFGKGTIYNYFSSKEELFFAILDQLTYKMEALAKSSVKGGAGSSRTMLTNYARSMLAHIRENSDLFHLIMHEIHRLNPEEHHRKMMRINSRMQSIWKTLARPLQNDRGKKVIKPFDPFSLAVLFDGMLRIYCFNRYGPLHSIKEQDMDQAVNMIVTIFFDGIGELNFKG